MSNSVVNVRNIGPSLIDPRRLLLEKQLDLAIRRAEQNYLKAGKSKVDNPSPNPSHLGTRIDIQA